MMLDLPPQVEMQIVEIAKQQNISIDDYVLLAVKEKLSQDNQINDDIDDDEFYRVTGIRPLPSRPNAKEITNDYINELREQYGI